jgi:TonB family protein
MIASFVFMATVMAAAPTTNKPWFEFHDYPMKAFRKHQEGVTRFDLLVDPQGRVEKCTISESSGSEDLDKTTCSLASFRARFAPARAPGGEATYGVFRSQAIWVIPEDTLANTSPGPDLQVSINKYPDGTQTPPAVQVAYLVDAQGRVGSCSALAGSLAQPASLVDVACREVASRLSPEPAKTAEGQAVAAVRTAAILFKAPQ